MSASFHANSSPSTISLLFSSPSLSPSRCSLPNSKSSKTFPHVATHHNRPSSSNSLPPLPHPPLTLNPFTSFSLPPQPPIHPYLPSPSLLKTHPPSSSFLLYDSHPHLFPYLTPRSLASFFHLQILFLFILFHPHINPIPLPISHPSPSFDLFFISYSRLNLPCQALNSLCRLSHMGFVPSPRSSNSSLNCLLRAHKFSSW